MRRIDDRVHACAGACIGKQSVDLRVVATDGRRLQFRNHAVERFTSEGRAGDPHRIDDPRDAFFPRRLSAQEHRVDVFGGAEVQLQRLAATGDLRRLPWIMRHDRARADRKQRIRTVVDRHIIRDRVHEGRGTLNRVHPCIYLISEVFVDHSWLLTPAVYLRSLPVFPTSAVLLPRPMSPSGTTRNGPRSGWS